MHDGFYFRLSLGGGYFTSGLEGGGTSFDINGGSVGLDLMIGGTPSPGLAIGGAYFFDRAPSPTVSSGNASGTLDYTLNFGIIGPFVDWFPDPRGGFHFGGALGLSFLSLSSSGDDVQASSTGFGGGLFTGYDAWIGDQWSLGVVARATAAAESDTTNGVKESLSPWNFAVMISVLNH